MRTLHSRRQRTSRCRREIRDDDDKPVMIYFGRKIATAEDESLEATEGTFSVTTACCHQRQAAAPRARSSLGSQNSKFFGYSFAPPRQFSHQLLTASTSNLPSILLALILIPLAQVQVARSVTLASHQLHPLVMMIAFSKRCGCRTSLTKKTVRSLHTVPSLPRPPHDRSSATYVWKRCPMIQSLIPILVDMPSRTCHHTPQRT